MSHPFDRYADITNLDALLSMSAKSSRRSVRVNTLKASVEDFQKYAKEKGWEVEGVRWCEEGFFIRSFDTLRDATTRDDTPVPIGKDLLHQLGHIYIQEAASMLPVALLDPQPGDAILDVCAAPGSKTTQMAGKMTKPCIDSVQYDTVNTAMHGVIVANDVQEKRLWTLREALQRSGVTNVVLTKKSGEWFGKYMIEQFDRVLCDAPCSAQGVVRSDPKAINYCNPKRIASLHNAQVSLLTAAIHAAKVGGRVVYSTCTLTPEENEEVVAEVLRKFERKVELVASDKLQVTSCLDQALQNSLNAQRNLQPATCNLQLYRLWPHTYDTEGFFAAVLIKTDHTRDVIDHEPMSYRESRLKKNARRDLLSELEKRYGTSFINENEELYEDGGSLVVVSKDVDRFTLPATDFGIGLPFGKREKKGFFRLSHDLVIARGNSATNNVCELTDNQLADILSGKDAQCSEEFRGETILRYRDLAIGIGMAKEGIMKNWLPRRALQQMQ